MASSIQRLMTRKVVEMFARNTFVGTCVFALDLLILWGLVTAFVVPAVIAATIGFLVASSLHYYVARAWIFRGTSRHPVSGYFYFILNAGIGLSITLIMFSLFLEWTSINYILARIAVSIVAGLAMFFLNAAWNFRKI